jgi:hypothetical protein
MLGERADGELVLAVADPTHAGGRIEIELARGAAEVISSDEMIEVEELGPTVKLTVNVEGTRGRSLTIKLRAS